MGFVLYITSVVFASFRIITALFLKDAMTVAANDPEMMVKERLAQRESYLHKLLDFFEAADTNGDGRVSVQEFHEILQNERIKVWLSTLEIDATEAQELFDLLVTDGQGSLSENEFV